MDTEHIFYKIGKVFLLILIIGSASLYIIGLDKLLDIVPPCAFYTDTRIYCPGCGGTRAVVSLLKGNLVQSFLYHPFVLYFVVNYSVFMIYEFCKKHLHILKKRYPIEIMLYIGVGVLLLQWLIKVILQFVL